MSENQRMDDMAEVNRKKVANVLARYRKLNDNEKTAFRGFAGLKHKPNIDVNKCPFRTPDIMTGEPSSYCMVGDCVFNLENEDDCAIFATHKRLMEEKEVLLKECMHGAPTE